MKLKNAIIIILITFVIGLAIGGIQRLFEVETILGMDGDLFAVIIGAVTGIIIGVIIEKRTEEKVENGK